MKISFKPWRVSLCCVLVRTLHSLSSISNQDHDMGNTILGNTLTRLCLTHEMTKWHNGQPKQHSSQPKQSITNSTVVSSQQLTLTDTCISHRLLPLHGAILTFRHFKQICPLKKMLRAFERQNAGQALHSMREANESSNPAYIQYHLSFWYISVGQYILYQHPFSFPGSSFDQIS